MSSTPLSSSLRAIEAHGIHRAYGERTVLDGVDLTVPPGARIGLIGENGVGKSTLLRILAGVEAPDGGTVARPARTGFLWQEAPVDPDATVADLIDHATAELVDIAREFEDAASGLDGTDAAADRYQRAFEAAERADVWSLDARRDETLAALGVAAIGLDRPVASLSGGQRSRVSLAGLLLARPDALLLDEPTNHLDDAAVGFLRAALIGWSGPVLFASHDRAFLDEVATGLADLDPDRSRTVTHYGGGFSDYLSAKRRERERWEQQYHDEQDELARLSGLSIAGAHRVAHGRGPTDNDKFIHKFKGAKAQAAVARRLHDAERRHDELAERQVRKPPAPLRFAGIPAATAVGDEEGTLLQVNDLGLAGRLALDELRIGTRDRILVTGPNGAGKSTLLHLLAGDLEPDAGGIRRRRGLRIGLLRQDVRFPDPQRTPRQLYTELVGERRAEAMPLSSLGLVPPAQLDRPVGTLSVGQQRRLALALVIARPPHLFLLDEPSNHLSLQLANELEEALGDYPGAVVVASHDRWLRRRWGGTEITLRSPAMIGR